MAEPLTIAVAQIWKLLSASMKVALTTLVFCILMLWAASDEIGEASVAFRWLAYACLSVIFVNVLYFIWDATPKLWKLLSARRETSRKTKETDLSATNSLNHLNAYERSFLVSILQDLADDSGLFRISPSTNNRDDDLRVLRDRGIIRPSSPNEVRLGTAYVVWWQLSPAVVKDRKAIIKKLSPMKV